MAADGFRLQQNGDEDDASENSEEYADRVGQLQRVTMARFAGPAGKAALQRMSATAAESHAHRIGDQVRALAQLTTPTSTSTPTLISSIASKWPPARTAPLSLLPTDELHLPDGKGLTQRQALKDATVQRLDDRMQRLHAALQAGVAMGTDAQRRLCLAGQRPPWPPLARTGAGAVAGGLKVGEAMRAVEDLLGGQVTGALVLNPPSPTDTERDSSTSSGPVYLALMLEFHLDTLPLALAVVFVSLATSSRSKPPAFWTRALMESAASDDAPTNTNIRWHYRCYAWTSFDLAAAAASGNGHRL